MKRRPLPVLLSLALPALALAACGQSAAPAALTLADACQDYAVAYCPQHHACQAVADATLFGDVATCVERIALDCAEKAAVPGTSYGVGPLEACAEELRRSDCEAIFSAQGYELPACTTLARGTVAGQGLCNIDLQCQSGRCSFDDDPTAACGTCASIVAPGMQCDGVDNLCGPGIYCDSAEELCLVLADEGDPCDEFTVSCAAGLTCPFGLCAKPPGPGDPCGQSMIDSCDDARGITCDENTGTCAAPQVVIRAVGESCFMPAPPIVVVCGSGSYCDESLGQAPLCKPRPLDGGFCEVSKIDPCLSPFTCIEGACSPPDLAVCN